MTKYSCVTPYWDTVTCELDISGCPKEECIYNLTFSPKPEDEYDYEDEDDYEDEYEYVSHRVAFV